MTILTFIAALVTGFLASLGVGGGMVLIIWMTAILGTPQLEAQGINLIFFIPIALVSVILHYKNGLIELKKMILPIVMGSIGAAVGSLTAHYIGSDSLRKIFAVFILLIGIKTLFFEKKAKEKE